jgi:hypothetical protein
MNIDEVGSVNWGSRGCAMNSVNAMAFRRNGGY